MKTNLIRALSLVSLLGAAVGAFAQSGSSIRVTVPFDFRVNGQKMAAGDYTVGEDLGNGVVSLYNFQTKQTALVLTEPAGGNLTGAAPRLTFEKHDGESVLVRVSALTGSARQFHNGAQILK